jgi:hypothetical protein
MNKRTNIIVVLLMFVGLYADEYTRTYAPTAGVSAISSSATPGSGLIGEFEAIETVLNGNLDTANIKDNSLLNADFANDTIETGKVKAGTLTPADMANLTTIAAGSLVYATATSTLGSIPIGTNGQYLVSNGTVPGWSSPSSSGWTDNGSVLYPDSANDNVAIGGSTIGTNGRAVLALFNNVVPSTSVTNGVQLYAEDVAASSELKVRDEAGNITTLSPHNFSLIPEERLDDYELPFSFYSKNNEIGKEINVDMYGAIKEVEKLSGKQFIFINKITRKDVNEDTTKLPSWVKKAIKKAKKAEKEGK